MLASLPFAHEKLDAYDLALDFVAGADQVIERCLADAVISPISSNESP